MEINDLWEKLSPSPENIEIIKEDLKRGLAPNFPFFIVDMETAKLELKKGIETIDKTFQYYLIRGQYGNGKTNLFKYLKYFFQLKPEYKINVINWRADVDRYDIVMQMLYMLQNNYSDELAKALKTLDKNELKKCCNNFADSFSVLKDFVDTIESNKHEIEKIKHLIQLGTGKIYNAGSFNLYHLSKFSDYNRREVLVFFLNVLAKNNFYIIFCLDEIEKIQEKSRARFQGFLTSFRELIDISSFMHGHLIIAAITDAASNTNIPIESYNEAFARRIKNRICELSVITRIEDIAEMTSSINEILGTKKTTEEITTIAKSVYQKKLSHNNDFVVTICNLLAQNENLKSWVDLLDDNLKKEFDEKKKQLEDDGIDIRINQKLFVPLENYIKMIQNNETDYSINGVQYQCVMNNVTNKCYVFLFTNDVEANINRIKNVTNKFSGADLIIFKPNLLDINIPIIKDIYQKSDLIVYNPIELIALLELYIDDPFNEKIKETIDKYTNNL